MDEINLMNFSHGESPFYKWTKILKSGKSHWSLDPVSNGFVKTIINSDEDKEEDFNDNKKEIKFNFEDETKKTIFLKYKTPVFES